jgi:hypothetical protein
MCLDGVACAREWPPQRSEPSGPPVEFGSRSKACSLQTNVPRRFKEECEGLRRVSGSWIGVFAQEKLVQAIGKKGQGSHVSISQLRVAGREVRRVADECHELATVLETSENRGESL